MKIIKDFEIMQKLMDSYVCLETGWTDLLSNERSLRNSDDNCLNLLSFVCVTIRNTGNEKNIKQ